MLHLDHLSWLERLCKRSNYHTAHYNFTSIYTNCLEILLETVMPKRVQASPFKSLKICFLVPYKILIRLDSSSPVFKFRNLLFNKQVSIVRLRFTCSCFHLVHWPELTKRYNICSDDCVRKKCFATTLRTFGKIYVCLFFSKRLLK